MKYGFPSRLFLGLGTLIVGGLCAIDLAAQPPPPGKDKGPKGPPLAEVLTVSGTVREFTTAPAGEVDGFMLSDGTWVHWPPHLQDRFKDLAARGDRIRATGYWETGPKGDSKLEVAALTNVRTGKTVENPDRPLSGPARLRRSAGGDIEERLQALEDKLDRLISEVERLRRKK